MYSRTRTAVAFAILMHACAAAPPRELAAERDPPVATDLDASAPAPAASEVVPAAPGADASTVAPPTPDDAGDPDPSASDDVPAPPPKAQRYRPLGACVDPIRHAMKQMGGSSGSSKHDEFVAEPSVQGGSDLDGDGQEDQLVIGNIANITTTYFVYVMRGKCGHFAGRIAAVGRLEAVGNYAKGLRSLGGLAPCQPSCCRTLMYSEYRYDGARFKLAKKESRNVSDCTNDF